MNDHHMFSYKTVSAVLLLIVLGVLAYVFSLVAPASMEAPRLTGTLYLTAGNDTDLLPDPYALDVASGVLVMDGVADTGVGNFHSFSSDGKWVTFVGTTDAAMSQVVDETLAFGEAVQVYRARVFAGQTTLPLPGEAEQITDDGFISKRDPAISPNGERVAFVSFDAYADEEDPIDLSFDTPVSSEVYAAAAGAHTSSLYVGVGSHPQWIDDETIVYLTPEGIRSAVITEEVDTLIASEPTLLVSVDTSANMKMQLSPSGKLLILTDPNAATVFVYTVFRYGIDEYRVEYLKSIEGTTAFWAVASPDDAYLAVQTASQVTEGAGGDPFVVFFDLQSGEEIREWPLIGVDNNQLFLTAWR